MNNAVMFDYDGHLSSASEEASAVVDDEEQKEAEKKDELHRVMRLKGYSMDEEPERPQLRANSVVKKMDSRKSILKAGTSRQTLQ
jgi:hypothetical protein